MSCKLQLWGHDSDTIRVLVFQNMTVRPKDLAKTLAPMSTVIQKTWLRDCLCPIYCILNGRDEYMKKYQTILLSQQDRSLCKTVLNFQIQFSRMNELNIWSNDCWPWRCLTTCQRWSILVRSFKWRWKLATSHCILSGNILRILHSLYVTWQLCK